jgi:hypothetical protein
MEAVGYALDFAGIATVAAALVWSFVVVYRESAPLAVLCLFLPMGLPVVMLLQWPRTWRPLCLWALGFTIFFCGLALVHPGD